MFKIFHLRYERLDIQFECTIAAKNLANAAKNIGRALIFLLNSGANSLLIGDLLGRFNINSFLDLCFNAA